jgi:uncharacterized protein (TIGR01244 family)
MQRETVMARQLDDRTLVSGQIGAADIPALAKQGVGLIINNRPDGEDPDQPLSAELEAAAKAAGVAYCHIPISRGIGPSDVEAMQDALNSCKQGKVLAFCRSGTRSTLAWAVARREDGVPVEDLQRAGDNVGVDIGPVAHLL